MISLRSKALEWVQPILRSELFRSAGIYTLASVVNAAVPFLLMPLLTRHLTPTDYGTVSMLQVLAGVLMPFMGLSAYGALSVKYYEKGSPDLAAFIGNAVMLVTGASVAVGTLIWVFAGPVSSLIAFPREWLWAAVALNYFQSITLLLLSLWQCQVEPLRYGAYQILQTSLNMALSIIWVVALDRGWTGRVEAQLFSISVFGVLALFLLRRGGWLKLVWSRQCVRDILAFGVPLIPHALGGMLIVQTDRIFISRMSGIADTGIYTVGFQIASILDFFTVSFNRAFAPWLFKNLSSEDPSFRYRVVKFTYLYFFGILFVAILFSWAAPWFLGFFVGKDFASAGRYTRWIAMGFAFNSMYYMVANYIFYAKKTHVLAWVTFFTAMVNVILNYALISRNGPLGAAQASACAFLLGFLLTWALSARVYPMPWRLALQVPIPGSLL